MPVNVNRVEQNQNVKYKDNLYDTIDTTGYRLETLDSENSDMDRRPKERVRQKQYIVSR